MSNSYRFSAALLTFTLLSISSTLARASAPQLSDFFQEWTLDQTQSNSANCHRLLSALPLDEIPGVNGIPGPGYDSATGITFTFNDPSSDPYDFPAGTEDSLITSGQPSMDSSGHTSKTAQLTGTLLSTKGESFTLLSNDGLIYLASTKKAKTTCNYVSAHSSLVGMVETGANLVIDGKQIASCTFLPATPRPDQTDFSYNEKCSFGKYVLKTYLTSTGEVDKTVIEENDQAQNKMELVRSILKLNNATENYFSRDTEILVEDDSNGISVPPVDDLSSNNDEFFISPYHTQSYVISGADNAEIQFVYASQ